MESRPAKQYSDLEEEEVLQLQERLGAMPTNNYYLLAILAWVILVFYLTIPGSSETERGFSWGIFSVAGLLFGGLAIYGLGSEKRNIRKDLVYRSKYLRNHTVLGKQRFYSPERYFLELADFPNLLAVSREMYEEAKEGDAISIGYTRFARHRLDDGLTLSSLVPKTEVDE